MADTAKLADKVADSRKETIDFMVVVQELEEWAQKPQDSTMRLASVH
jgi:hypothetical protein